MNPPIKWGPKIESPWFPIVFRDFPDFPYEN
jgi:hypothetical protein